MKALALGLAFVLVACASSASNDGESGSSAVSATPTSTSSTASPPQTASSDTTAPDTTHDRCAELGAKAPSGKIEITGGESGIAQFIDLEAEDTDLVQPDGSHVYSFVLSFTSTANQCAYRNAGAAPPTHTAFSFSVSQRSDVPLETPFPAGSYDNGGGATTFGQCGGADPTNSGLGMNDMTGDITITSRTDAAVQGTVEITNNDGSEVILAGQFNAPLCHPNALAAAAPTLCCPWQN